ncbi:hypothetical protein [Nonomuraea rubra]|uniref:hypothetical protein n=1 Tax=Nonomuraea rubra TaxID=46180 RepID=UPI003CD0B2E8
MRRCARIEARAQARARARIEARARPWGRRAGAGAAPERGAEAGVGSWRAMRWWNARHDRGNHQFTPPINRIEAGTSKRPHQRRIHHDRHEHPTPSNFTIVIPAVENAPITTSQPAAPHC